MRHTVLMAYSRPENFDILHEHMAGQQVEWRPLYDDPAIHAEMTDVSKRFSWIKPWYGKLPRNGDGTPKVNPGNHMVDTFLDWACEFEPKFFDADNYISFMTDDCLWSWKFWTKLRGHFDDPKYTPPALVIAAHRNGNNIVSAMYTRNTQTLWEGNTCLCFATRVEALTVRADLMKSIRFGKLWCADGILVERLVEENHGRIALANNCMVYFNALRPECWGFPATHQPK